MLKTTSSSVQCGFCGLPIVTKDYAKYPGTGGSVDTYGCLDCHTHHSLKMGTNNNATMMPPPPPAKRKRTEGEKEVEEKEREREYWLLFQHYRESTSIPLGRTNIVIGLQGTLAETDMNEWSETMRLRWLAVDPGCYEQEPVSTFLINSLPLAQPPSSSDTERRSVSVTYVITGSSLISTTFLHNVPTTNQGRLFKASMEHMAKELHGIHSQSCALLNMLVLDETD